VPILLPVASFTARTNNKIYLTCWLTLIVQNYWDKILLLDVILSQINPFLIITYCLRDINLHAILLNLLSVYQTDIFLHV
jgi:hypothetical protein